MADLVIWKFPVALEDKFSISIPSGAQILTLQLQRGRPQMWVLVNPEAPPEQRTFHIVGTGHRYSARTLSLWRYRGTFQMQDGAFVWHVFEEALRGVDEALRQPEEPAG